MKKIVDTMEQKPNKLNTQHNNLPPPLYTISFPPQQIISLSFLTL